MTPALEVRDLSVQYGGFRALDGFDLTVQPGSIAALIGPNGAGKTTCFNAICGYVRASGSVKVHGRPMKLGDPHRAWAAGLARTFQRLELYLTLSVREHLELAQREARRIERVGAPPDELLELLGLKEEADVLAANLPLGRCRVLELGRALATGGDVLMLDESVSGLDRDESIAFGEVVRQAQVARGVTVVLIEHDLEFVASLATEITVLDFGRLIASGPRDAVLADPRVRDVYLGAAVVA